MTSLLLFPFHQSVYNDPKLSPSVISCQGLLSFHILSMKKPWEQNKVVLLCFMILETNLLLPIGNSWRKIQPIDPFLQRFEDVNI